MGRRGEIATNFIFGPSFKVKAISLNKTESAI